jgi:poly-beta-1,6-N-acetyl-D-glucosamine synthase
MMPTTFGTEPLGKICFYRTKRILIRMDVSIGIMAYNEENNIGRLLEKLLSQKLQNCNIREIIVVNDGSTDNTLRIVTSFSKEHDEIKIIHHPARRGKPSAINGFLLAASSPILVLESADTLPEEHSIEALCAPLQDESVGITAGSTIPLNNESTFLGRLVHSQWRIHHHLSNEMPKFCELIAFRNVVPFVEPTTVDEEYIGSVVMKKGYRAVYANAAIVYTMGPGQVGEFFEQRRRNHSGHLLLQKKTGYTSPSLRLPLIASAVGKEISLKTLPSIGAGILIEAIARALGRIDCMRGRIDVLWDQATTTKKLIVSKAKRDNEFLVPFDSAHISK